MIRDLKMTTRSVTTIVIVMIAVAGLIPLGEMARELYLMDSVLRRTFPGMPSGYSDDIGMAIVLSPTLLRLGRVEDRLLRFIQYPYLDLPGTKPLSSGNALQDQIYLAQTLQGLAPITVAGGAVPADGDFDLNTSSLEAVGRAFYFNRIKPALAEYLMDTQPEASVRANSNQVERVAMRNIFAAVYGPKVLQQMLKHNHF